MKKRKSRVGINRYIGLSLLSYLFDRCQPVCDELLEAASCTYPNLKHHYSILSSFDKYLFSLYYCNHINNACSNIEYLTSKALSKDIPVKPTLLTLCELLEIPIMVLLISFSKLMSFPVYFPNALICYKKFCEMLYSREEQFGIDIAVHKMQNTDKEKLSSAIQSLLKLLVGENLSKHNPIFMMSEVLASFIYQKNEQTALNQTHCERLLILYLVILINLPQGLPGGKQIIRAFRPHTIKGDGKLIRVFNAVQNLTNRDEAKELLSGLLKMKNGYLVQFNQRAKQHNIKARNNPDTPVKIMNRKATVEMHTKSLKQTEEMIENFS